MFFFAWVRFDEKTVNGAWKSVVIFSLTLLGSMV